MEKPEEQNKKVAQILAIIMVSFFLIFIFIKFVLF
jgi:hypothetical protein